MFNIFNISEAASIALHSMAYIASRDSIVKTAEISSKLDVSENHLSKVLQRLAKKGLVKSMRGPGGGFVLGKPVNTISLKDVYETIEGEMTAQHCLFDNSTCDSDKCILGDVLDESGRLFENHLVKTKLSDVIGLYQ